MFERAEKLGMTVGQLEVTMDHAEFVEWQLLDSIRADEAERAQQQAKKGMRPRRRRSRRAS